MLSHKDAEQFVRTFSLVKNSALRNAGSSHHWRYQPRLILEAKLPLLSGRSKFTNMKVLLAPLLLQLDKLPHQLISASQRVNQC